MTRILTSLLMLLFVQPAMAQRKYNKTSTDSLQIYMVKVEGGSFDLGSDNGASDRKPAHTVKLKDFSIGAYEVTQLQWVIIMDDNPAGSYRCPDCPVNNVSWSDVQTFIERLNGATGKHYRLPTEAEWEYAARGGIHEELVKDKTTPRGGVNEFMISDKNLRRPEKEREGKKWSGRSGGPQSVAWYRNNSQNHIHSIGRKQPNELGLYDMSGNVEEWCNDFYATTYGSKNTIENPLGPANGKSHVVRGGSFTDYADDVVVTRRAGYLPDTKAVSLGFRLAEDK